MNILIILFTMITFLIMASDPRAGDLETQASAVHNNASANKIAVLNLHDDAEES